VRAVSTPGHTHGHGPVAVHACGVWVLLAGDASFDAEQVATGTAAGICADPAAARRTLGVIRGQLERFPTVYLPAHDPDAARRLAAAETTRV
jgi:N-acyl homoserine lactone hydrolase